MAKDKTEPSKVEKAKIASEFLRGTIDETLKNPEMECAVKIRWPTWKYMQSVPRVSVITPRANMVKCHFFNCWW